MGERLVHYKIGFNTGGVVPKSVRDSLVSIIKTFGGTNIATILNGVSCWIPEKRTEKFDQSIGCDVQKGEPCSLAYRILAKDEETESSCTMTVDREKELAKGRAYIEPKVESKQNSMHKVLLEIWKK